MLIGHFVSGEQEGSTINALHTCTPSCVSLCRFTPGLLVLSYNGSKEDREGLREEVMENVSRQVEDECVCMCVYMCELLLVVG